MQKYFRVSLLPRSVPFSLHERLPVPSLVLFAASTVTGLLHVFNKPDPLENEAATAFTGSGLVVAAVIATWFALADKHHIDNVAVFAPVPASAGDDSSGSATS